MGEKEGGEGREREKESGREREREAARGDKTSRSGRSVLIKRTQRPRTLNALEPVDVFQRGRIVNYGGRRRRRRSSRRRGDGGGGRSVGSRVCNFVSRARSWRTGNDGWRKQGREGDEREGRKKDEDGSDRSSSTREEGRRKGGGDRGHH